MDNGQKYKHFPYTFKKTSKDLGNSDYSITVAQAIWKKRRYKISVKKYGLLNQDLIEQLLPSHLKIFIK